jgi:hypothetical protein
VTLLLLCPIGVVVCSVDSVDPHPWQRAAGGTYTYAPPTPERHTAATGVVINEVARSGGGGACNGEDWVELYNLGATFVNLAGYKLHDDKVGLLHKLNRQIDP